MRDEKLEVIIAHKLKHGLLGLWFLFLQLDFHLYEASLSPLLMSRAKSALKSSGLSWQLQMNDQAVEWMIAATFFLVLILLLAAQLPPSICVDLVVLCWAWTILFLSLFIFFLFFFFLKKIYLQSEYGSPYQWAFRHFGSNASPGIALLT